MMRATVVVTIPLSWGVVMLMMMLILMTVVVTVRMMMMMMMVMVMITWNTKARAVFQSCPGYWASPSWPPPSVSLT